MYDSNIDMGIYCHTVFCLIVEMSHALYHFKLSVIIWLTSEHTFKVTPGKGAFILRSLSSAYTVEWHESTISQRLRVVFSPIQAKQE